MIHTWQTLALAAGLFTSAGCLADGAAIAQTGAGAAVPACQTWHGPAGESVAQAGFPHLANLGAPCLQRQLASFADGTRGNAGGRGVGGDFPAIAGQGAAYLTNQLTAWKTGTRPPGPMGLMVQVAKKLSDDEVRAVARHDAALPAGATP